MVNPLPAIRLTDPHAKDSAPSYPLSPIDKWDGEFRRPTSPASKRDRDERPGSANSNPATKVFRAMNNVLSASNGDHAQTEDGPSTRLEITPTVDPLSQQIFDRTGETHPVVVRHNSNDTVHSADVQDEKRDALLSGPTPRMDTEQAHQVKEKAVSFLSRMMGSKKRDHPRSAKDNISIAESRTEGNDAEVFSPDMATADFSRVRSHAPHYIRTHTRHTKRKHFDSLFLAQELMAGVPTRDHSSHRKKSMTPEPPAAWAAEFSKDGKYLATAGNDKIIRIWALLITPAERQAERNSTSGTSPGLSYHQAGLTAQVFQSKPIREFRGHSSTVLDLSWSKNNFLLSSSMDKTVRLWHTTRKECLCTFKHTDFVPSIAFHPKDDRFFLTGSLDCKLRLWSIPDKHVAYWTQLSEMLTSVAFSPDGKHAIAGGSHGLCMIYETEGLRYQSQIRVKAAHNKHGKGSKITGIQTFTHPPNTTSGDTKMLITSNDSRVRLYNFRDRLLEMKFKGCDNMSSQIRASLSDDQRYIACGSEDNRAYMWPLSFSDNEDPTKRPLEHFQAHDSATTCVRFAPPRARHLLSSSADPIYDLCNPQEPGGKLERTTSFVSSHPPTGSVSSATPELLRTKTGFSRFSAEPHAPHSTHPHGNIIVTASYNGCIKVFRQDCAARHRKPSAMRRVTSMATSQADSLKGKGSNHSLRSGRDSTSTQPSSERILSWRQTVDSDPSVRTGSLNSKHSARSLSPHKANSTLRSVSGPQPQRSAMATDNSSSGASTPSTSVSASPHLPSLAMTPISPVPRTNGNRAVSAPVQPPAKNNASPLPDKAQQADPRARDKETGTAYPSTAENPLMLAGEQSNLFWNVAAQRNFAERAKQAALDSETERKREEELSGVGEGTMGHSTGLGVQLRRKVSRDRSSFVSRLSIERSGSEGGESR